MISMTIDERICDITQVNAVSDISGLTCKMAACAIYSGSRTSRYISGPVLCIRHPQE